MREYKLNAVKCFYDNDENVSRASTHFKVDRKRVKEWVKPEETIQKQKYNTRKNKSGRKAIYPKVESELYKVFLDMRKSGRKCKRWWFLSQAKRLIADNYPDVNEFKFSESWFRKRYRISLRKKTHTSQKSPNDAAIVVKTFHQTLRRARKAGTYKLNDIANMGQTPLSFIMGDNKTYEITNSSDVWCVLLVKTNACVLSS